MSVTKVEKVGHSIKVECFFEPRGFGGLEGYQVNERYKAILGNYEKGDRNG